MCEVPGVRFEGPGGGSILRLLESTFKTPGVRFEDPGGGRCLRPGSAIVRGPVRVEIKSPGIDVSGTESAIRGIR